MKIEKSVPMPDKKSTPARSKRKTYPIREMEVGDSILVTGDNACRRRVSNAAHMYGERNGKKFRAKTSTEGMRIWRIS